MKNAVWTQIIDRINEIKVLAVTDIQMHVEWNAHARFAIEGNVADKDEADMEKLLRDDELVTVYYQKSDGECAAFFVGLLWSIQIGRHLGGCYFKLVLTDFAHKMDRVERIRVFQNTSMTYETLLKEVLEPYGTIVMTDEGIEKNIGEVIVQYHETDWEFLKRIATHFHTRLLSNYRSTSAFLTIGFSDRPQEEMEADEFDIMGQNEMSGGQKQETPFYRCRTARIYSAGDQVLFMGRTLYIETVDLKYEAGELIFEYILKSKNSLKEAKLYNDRIIGASLDGKIADVKNDVVKVIVTDGDNASVADASWMPYSTIYSSPDGTGWYCMPEQGDSVRVYFPNEIEQNRYAVSAVHADGGTMGAMRSNPDNKSIATKYGKQIELTPADIKITNGNGMLICISDDDGIIVTSGKDIKLTAADNISLVSAGDTINFCASDSITLKQGENEIKVADDITVKGTKIKMQ